MNLFQNKVTGTHWHPQSQITSGGKDNSSPSWNLNLNSHPIATCLAAAEIIAVVEVVLVVVLAMIFMVVVIMVMVVVLVVVRSDSSGSGGCYDDSMMEIFLFNHIDDYFKLIFTDPQFQFCNL